MQVTALFCVQQFTICLTRWCVACGHVMQLGSAKASMYAADLRQISVHGADHDQYSCSIRLLHRD